MILYFYKCIYIMEYKSKEGVMCSLFYIYYLASITYILFGKGKRFGGCCIRFLLFSSLWFALSSVCKSVLLFFRKKNVISPFASLLAGESMTSQRHPFTLHCCWVPRVTAVNYAFLYPF